jgi:hypothetical protein
MFVLVKAGVEIEVRTRYAKNMRKRAVRNSSPVNPRDSKQVSCGVKYISHKSSYER